MGISLVDTTANLTNAKGWEKIIHIFNYSFKVSNAVSDEDLQGLLTSDDGLDTLEVIGYTGVPHRESITAKDKILQYVSLLLPCFTAVSTAHTGTSF